jgi:hypothetical protein
MRTTRRNFLRRTCCSRYVGERICRPARVICCQQGSALYRTRCGGRAHVVLERDRHRPRGCPAGVGGAMVKDRCGRRRETRGDDHVGGRVGQRRVCPMRSRANQSRTRRDVVPCCARYVPQSEVDPVLKGGRRSPTTRAPRNEELAALGTPSRTRPPHCLMRVGTARDPECLSCQQVGSAV